MDSSWVQQSPLGRHEGIQIMSFAEPDEINNRFRHRHRIMKKRPQKPYVHVGEFVDGTVEIVGDDYDSRFAAGSRNDGAYLASGDGVDRFVVAGPMSWPKWKVEPPTIGMQRPPMGEVIRWFFAFSGSTKPSAPVSGLALVSNGVSATAGNAPKAKAAAIAPEKVRVSIANRASLAVSPWSCTWTPCTASMVVRVFGACERTGTRLKQGKCPFARKGAG